MKFEEKEYLSASKLNQVTTQVDNQEAQLLELEKLADAKVEGSIQVVGSMSPTFSVYHYKAAENSVFEDFGYLQALNKGYPQHKLRNQWQRTEEGAETSGHTFTYTAYFAGWNYNPYQLTGIYTINGTQYRVLLFSRHPFKWRGISAFQKSRIAIGCSHCINVGFLYPSWTYPGFHSYPPMITLDWLWYWNEDKLAAGNVVATDARYEQLTSLSRSVIYWSPNVSVGHRAGTYTNPQSMTQVIEECKNTGFGRAITLQGFQQLFEAMYGELGTFDIYNANLFGYAPGVRPTRADFEDRGRTLRSGCRVKKDPTDESEPWRYYGVTEDVPECAKWHSDKFPFHPFSSMVTQRALSVMLENNIGEDWWCTGKEIAGYWEHCTAWRYSTIPGIDPHTGTALVSRLFQAAYCPRVLPWKPLECYQILHTIPIYRGFELNFFEPIILRDVFALVDETGVRFDCIMTFDEDYPVTQAAAKALLDYSPLLDKRSCYMSSHKGQYITDSTSLFPLKEVDGSETTNDCHSYSVVLPNNPTYPYYAPVAISLGATSTTSYSINLCALGKVEDGRTFFPHIEYPL